jgi:hypothetical protein
VRVAVFFTGTVFVIVVTVPTFREPEPTVTLPEPTFTSSRPETSAEGSLPSMLARDVFAVVWFEAVAAPLGSGRDAAETGCVACQNVPLTGCVTALPSTLSAVMLVAPCTVRTSLEGVPAVPSAGCFADVAAPDGRGSEAAETANVPVPAFAVTVPETVAVPCSCVFR